MNRFPRASPLWVSDPESVGMKPPEVLVGLWEFCAQNGVSAARRVVSSDGGRDEGQHSQRCPARPQVTNRTCQKWASPHWLLGRAAVPLCLGPMSA